jgi:hypothetical protein
MTNSPVAIDWYIGENDWANECYAPHIQSGIVVACHELLQASKSHPQGRHVLRVSDGQQVIYMTNVQPPLDTF